MEDNGSPIVADVGELYHQMLSSDRAASNCVSDQCIDTKSCRVRQVYCFGAALQTMSAQQRGVLKIPCLKHTFVHVVN